MNSTDNRREMEITGALQEGFQQILTPEALRFVATLAREFDARRLELLERRKAFQSRIDQGSLPDFLPETKNIREADWHIAPVPKDLQDRRVEITGPVERKMVINALNSGARTFMADFEDSHSPTWAGTIQGQINLRDAVNGTIAFTNPDGKEYRLHDDPAVLIVRPRGWHLVEAHARLEGKPVSAGIFDFGLFFFHNAENLLNKGSGPYFYLPKMESHLEARLWNDIFVRAESLLGIPPKSIKATVLIETLPAAFEMDEIIYELRDHMAGLNCGRWDYIFSFIKRMKNVPGYILPDRAQITMTSHCMRSYSLLAIQTCHRRGAHAIGGMAAQIPIKDDPKANEEALQKVAADKQREANDGHDGTWVAHPGLVAIAGKEFDAVMTTPNQIHRLREDVQIRREDLLMLPEGTITEEGFRTNISVGVQYIASWLGGNGCVPINHLMEDAATAEISRTQLWQWIHHPEGRLEDGRNIDTELFRQCMQEELEGIRQQMGEDAFSRQPFSLAASLFTEIVEKKELEEFLTLGAYDRLNA